jgi:hypothetical protein
VWIVLVLVVLGWLLGLAIGTARASRADPRGLPNRHPMTIIDLQRRVPGSRADELLDGLQAAVASDERVRWNESGHARLGVGQAPEDARAMLAARLDELGDDWPDHIAIL